MGLVRFIPKAGSALSPEQLARLEAAAKLPINFTPDCPKLTPEQLAEFEPVGMTWEERDRLMREKLKIPEKELVEAQ
jgi:hypothetical protein